MRFGRSGERESGTARLEEAVAAYREALEGIHPRARAARLGDDPEQPRQRARDARRARERHGAAGGGRRRLSRRARRNGPASACRSIGRRPRTTSAPRFGRSASARAARRGWRRRSPPIATRSRNRTRERVPLDWATTQNNLGNALATLGERESGTARLEEAVAAYREALEGMDPRARAARLGDDPEQPRQRASDARRARERHGAAGGGRRRLSRRAQGMDPRARAARLGR